MVRSQSSWAKPKRLEKWWASVSSHDAIVECRAIKINIGWLIPFRERFLLLLEKWENDIAHSDSRERHQLRHHNCERNRAPRNNCLPRWGERTNQWWDWGFVLKKRKVCQLYLLTFSFEIDHIRSLRRYQSIFERYYRKSSLCRLGQVSVHESSHFEVKRFIQL